MVTFVRAAKLLCIRSY